MKLAAICEAVKSMNEDVSGQQIRHVLVHTGRHNDVDISDMFFNDLELPKPDVCLGVGYGSQSLEIAKIMVRFESVVSSERPDVVLVVGDVNSSLACALVVKKKCCAEANGKGAYVPKLAHVEAGLRSFEPTMPEEINRVVTDALSDFLFTTEESANQNLLREGLSKEKIFFVGNVMIDTLLRHRAKADESRILSDLQLAGGEQVKPYAILTLHRPANVENVQRFSRMLEAFLEVSKRMPVIFPAHPQTLRQIHYAELGDFFVDHFMAGPEPWDNRVRIRIVPPLGYLDFLRLMARARLVLTDSGSIQEETTILGVPCLTLRENTERRATLECGTNVLVGSEPGKIIKEFDRILRGERSKRAAPKYWDGHAAERILRILRDRLRRGVVTGPAEDRGRVES